MKARALFCGRGVLPILVALAVAVLVGHICAVPAVAEWEHVGAGDSRAPGNSHDSDGSHIASCDATIFNTTPACPQSAAAPCAVVTTVTIDRGVRGRDVALETLIASRRAPDRSLFLLHASFLI